MARAPKTPKFDLFNSLENCFGRRQDQAEQLKDVVVAFDGPVICEFGCAAARLAIEVARRNPDSLVIAVDLKSERMAKPAQAAFEVGLKNILFLQTDTRQIFDFLPTNSVSKLWVTFPDPFPRKRQAKHRQTHPDFLAIYEQLLTRDGQLLFKTDDQPLFEYSIETLISKKWRLRDLSFDLFETDGREEARIVTVYEERWHKDGLTTKFLVAHPPAPTV